MCVIKIWELNSGLIEGGCCAKLVGELNGHRTGVNKTWVSSGKVWSGRYAVNQWILPY
jgi:hypothetical protein